MLLWRCVMKAAGPASASRPTGVAVRQLSAAAEGRSPAPGRLAARPPQPQLRGGPPRFHAPPQSPGHAAGSVRAAAGSAAATASSATSQPSAAAAAAASRTPSEEDELPFREYTAGRNAAYWQTRPVAVAARAVQISAALGDWYLHGWLRTRRSSAQRRRDLRADKLRELLVGLGPAFVKIGQAISSRPDVAPPEFLRELEKLQDQIPPFDSAAAFAVIQAEMGAPVPSLFSAISPQPVAAASLGQVYKATLRSDGREVAVKVQRPGVASAIALDVYILRQLAAAFKRWRKLNTDLPALLDEWASSLFRELDYRTEAANGVRFAQLYSHLEGVYVPACNTSLTTRKVLVMEWVDGERLRTAYTAASESVDVAGPSSSSDDLRLVEVGVRCSLEQMLEEGFYHADPHPGNLLKTPDGRLAYLDYGMMGQVDESIRQALIRATLHLVNREYEALADDFVTLGMLPPESDKSDIVPALTSVFAEALKGGVSNLSFGDLSTQLGTTMYQFQFRIPSYYTLLVRSLSVLEGIALASDPNYKVLGAAYPWIARRLLTDTTPELRSTLMALLYKGGRFNFRRMESLISQAVRPAGRPQPRRNPAPGESAVQRGDALALLLSPEGEFVRGVVVEELSKGIDAAWRLAADSLLAEVRGELIVLAAGGRAAAASSSAGSSSGGLGSASAATAFAASLPGSSPLAAALLELLSGLPALADAEDQEQVEGIARLAKVLQESTAAQRTAQGGDSSSTDWFGEGAAAAARSSSFVAGTPLEAAVEALETSAAILQWFAVEAQTLTPAERAEALRLPLSIGSAVSSRAAARVIRWAAAADVLGPQRPPAQGSASTSSSASSAWSSATPSASSAGGGASAAGGATAGTPAARRPASSSSTTSKSTSMPAMRQLSPTSSGLNSSSVGAAPTSVYRAGGGGTSSTVIVRPSATLAAAASSSSRNGSSR